ncbi:MAG: hypothetical protein JO000_04780, partial [Alphaproteobacteria bacterium]|nr:hypothetical protein [Alphaproteobacteria bacterium]
DRARLVTDGLLSPRFFSGWGIRTVARGEARYNPMSYHNGSIWPHDNALIALGFARYGLNRAVSQVAKGLLRPDFFSGWGIRTVARGEARYNPMSYHNGSIWPHDNALIALGFARYGLKQPIDRLFEGLFHAGTYMDHRRLPELFCGFQRQHGQGPTLYPVACAPQAWASAAPFSLIQSSLGLEFAPEQNEIRLRNPCLPGFIDEIVIRNLRLGHSVSDLRVHRHGSQVSVEPLRTRGEVQVSVVYSH